MRVIAWSYGAERYHEPARQLLEQCQHLDMSSSVVVGADLDEHMKKLISPEMQTRRWIFRYIPTFIRQQLDDTPEDVLYVHADFTIRARVSDQFAGVDVGYELGWSWGRPSDPCAAPLFFRNNDRARRFLRVWDAMCLNVDDHMSEHDQLRWLIPHMTWHDRSLRLKAFDPPLFDIRAEPESDAPIHGHKRF